MLYYLGIIKELVVYFRTNLYFKNFVPIKFKKYVTIILEFLYILFVQRNYT